MKPYTKRTAPLRLLRSASAGTILALAAYPTIAQTCGTAVSQLQNYVAQVNSFAHTEYYQGIPMRCGGNPGCMQMWLVQLNGWYSQQTAMVNNWYMQIVSQCAQGSSPGGIRTRRPGRDSPGEIDESSVEDIQVDDEDKTVRIKIPSTPRGFR